MLEEKYQKKLKDKKDEMAKNNFEHLKSIKQGEIPIIIEENKENEENMINNISSQNKLVEFEDKNILNDIINKDKNTENADNKFTENESLLEEKELERSESSKGHKIINTNDFDRKNWESRNYESIIREDFKKEKKILLIRNIVSIFRLLIRKNINYLKNNFIYYYTNNNDQFNFDEFVERCIPCIEDGNENVNRLIRRYCEPKIENSFSSNGYINLNNFFESKVDEFNFIQNIIISFANSEEEETQEILIGLLYKYFHQYYLEIFSNLMNIYYQKVEIK